MRRSASFKVHDVAESQSRRDGRPLLRDPVYREAARHRTAGVEDSRLLRLQPANAGAEFGETL